MPFACHPLAFASDKLLLSTERRPPAGTDTQNGWLYPINVTYFTSEWTFIIPCMAATKSYYGDVELEAMRGEVVWQD